MAPRVITGREHAVRKPFRLLPVIIVIYTVSFFLPVGTDDDGTIRSRSSGAAIFVDILSCEMYPTFPADLPNVVLWIGLLCLAWRNWLWAGICGTLALIGGVLDGVLVGSSLNFASGYYAWLSSMALLVVAGFARSR